MNVASVRQILMARYGLNWSQAELAKRANLSVPSIARIETNAVNMRIDTALKITKALEEGGAIFVNGVEQEGVVFKIGEA